MSLPKHIIENYQRFVDAGERTWQSIAEQAEKDGATSLAKYAHNKAENADEPTFDAASTAEDAPNYEKLTVADLKALVTERGIQVKSGAVKNDYVEALTASDTAASTGTGDGSQAGGDGTEQQSGEGTGGDADGAGAAQSGSADAGATPPAQ
jgi:hypothetical protein